jgi:uncharacterized OB-fold protein
VGGEFISHWRENESHYGLVGRECLCCNAKIFPPREICPHCNSENLRKFQFSGRGKIYSFTTIYDAPEGFEGQTPYSVAIIELDEGPKVTAQLVIERRNNGAGQKELITRMGNKEIPVKIDSRVRMVTRKLREIGKNGPILYSYKFEPDF